MTKSFLHVLLPDDEYKRERMLYFLAETAIITIILCLCIAISNRFIFPSSDQSIIPLFLIPVFMVLYPFARYIFSGMEYAEVANEKTYKQKRKEKMSQSIVSGMIFFIIFNIIRGFPVNANEWYEIISISILYAISLFVINYISLKNSYKKNKDLND